MTERFYIVNGVLEFSRKEFIDFLIEFIIENEVGEEIACIGSNRPEIVSRKVEHHPLRTGMALGYEVYTYLK